MSEREIHPSHNPEPEDGPRLYKGGRACRRCCRFVAFDGTVYRVTESGAAPCRPARLDLRAETPVVRSCPYCLNTEHGDLPCIN
jgi:hypothetical protein